jgi:hypothetical protein
MIRCAILAITETFFTLEFCGAGRTSPCDKSWSEFKIILQIVDVSIKLLNKIKSQNTITAIP